MKDASMSDNLPDLGDLEREVMQLIWANGRLTAETVREKLPRRLKESTVRTVLRRLEEKRYVSHTVEGRTYVYQATQPRGRVAAKAVQRHRRLVLQRIGRGGAGRHGGQLHARPAAIAEAGGQGGEGEGREVAMLGLLVECALRSLALGVVVWLGLALLRVRNPHAHMTAWTVVLVASLAMPLLVHRLTLTIPAATAVLARGRGPDVGIIDPTARAGFGSGVTGANLGRLVTFTAG